MSKVWVIDHSVESRHVLERIRILIHLLHVVHLEHALDNVLWNISNCELMLIDQLCRIVPFVNVDLKSLPVGHVEQQEQSLQVTSVLDDILEEDAIMHCHSGWVGIFF